MSRLIKTCITAFLLSLLNIAANPAMAQVMDDDAGSLEPVASPATHVISEAEYNKEVLSRKEALVQILEQRLENAIGEQGPGRSRRVSLFAFELFVAETRLAAEQIKSWQSEQQDALLSDSASPGTAASESYFEELREKKMAAEQKWSMRANALRPLVVEPHVRKQFDQYLSDIKLEVNNGD